MYLPQSTINVNGTRPFPSSGSIQILTTTGSPTITYSNTSVDQNGNTIKFNGCQGGTGLMKMNHLVGELSGNTTTATHFHNTISLFNYTEQTWDPWYDHEFDRTAFLHDCTTCGDVCSYWGPMFETFMCPPGGPLPPIGVTDMLTKIDDERWVRGKAPNVSYSPNLGGCNPPQNPPYQQWSYLPNYRWIIQSAP